jgi:uncharacterized membrane protein YeiH
MISLPYALDLIGTFVFALSGALAGVKNRLDIFGVLVLSFAAANTGGIIRDVLIGAVPTHRSNLILLFDAAGLALFAVSGAHKALLHGLNPVMATLLGMLTGIGGGMARDILLAEIPTVLRADLYAVAALAGAAVVVIANGLQWPSGPATLIGATLCFGLRVVAIKRHWQLPIAGV